ncbi:twin-arginine translocase TatA/TatE family subunit [Protaetiibacter larvae]|uniref:Sec-independent protein translocase protein TatA n=1 Tax=Protaetiibacter larvae TaxID=2592654 RepID=A0A5C1YB02_9MICO|nr:twin-arginine translocase TatA/TatE family subunit [Protaetiibacter larvae]QEO10027.1 twin-arginine translocase TatA/TatE family subunit [Protaetiibacter larvae]
MPFGNAFGWPHLLIILVVILLLFGATKLPALAKGVGQSVKVFRKEMKSDDEADGTATSEAASGDTTPAASTPADTASKPADKP